MDYEKTKQTWEGYSNSKKEEIILGVDEIVEQHMHQEKGDLRGAVFPEVMTAAGDIGIDSDMFYYIMELQKGKRYAFTELCIHDKLEWEIFMDLTWEEYEESFNAHA